MSQSEKTTDPLSERARPRRLRASRRTLAGLALLALALLLGWAFLWPVDACQHPACARQRFALALEVDAFQRVPPVQFELKNRNERVSLVSILAAGGIDIEPFYDQNDLPYRAASGPLDRADLYQFARAWRNESVPPGADAKIYALLAPALVSDTGEPLFGIMFDFADREGIAVAPTATKHRFAKREPDSVELLQLRTFVHELLHALNRRHMDALEMRDGRLTLEAPTRCISGEERGHWFLREEPLMAISPQTIRFFQTAASRDVLPGRERSSYDFGRASPTECQDVRSNRWDDLVESRWQVALRRLLGLVTIGSARAADSEDPEDSEGAEDAEDSNDAEEAPEEPPAPQVELRLQLLPAAYPLGYPIAARIMALNTGSEPLPIRGRLHPGYGMVQIEYRAAGEEEWQLLKPAVTFEPVDNDETLLGPGERTEHTAPLYFGDQGWTFAEPGDYEVRAKLHLGSDGGEALSDAVALTIEEARTPDDQAVLAPLLNSEGQLDLAVGQLLTYGGRIGSPKDLTPLEEATQQYGHTALGSALRLTLISQQLRPPIDPLTGERPAPDFADARELLKETCTDSGIAALKQQLLERHSGAIPEGMHDRAESAAAAWDGTTARPGETIPTYSDPTLVPWGPALHFCFGESRLRVPARAEIPRLARKLRSAEAKRIVIVGHADYAGTCRYNDAIGLRRADAVRRALAQAGVPSRKMQIASLGERRPLDFAAAPDAHDLNRRVEILVEGFEPADEPTRRALPRCPPHAQSR
ncbi:MAG TPA: OmpA family protein [Steroidobacteraceae bacterium]